MDRVAADLLPTRALTDAERDSIQDILDGAYAWSRGEMPISAVMQLGIVEYDGRPSPAYSRWVAIGKTPHSDPRWQALHDMIDLVVRKQFIVTTQGVFTPVEITQHHHALTKLRDHPEAA